MKFASMIAAAAISGLVALGATAASAEPEMMHGRSMHRMHHHMKMHHHHHMMMKHHHHMMHRNHMGNHKMRGHM